MVGIENAVILAAGYSSRFVPVCFDLPKGLLVVKGESLIERQIRQLHEVGISDITVVTGAYAEQFEFLRDKHHVRLVFNRDYAKKNNFASLYAARDFLGNTLVSSSDLFFARNIFQNQVEHGYYASVFESGWTTQRALTLDENDKIIATRYGACSCWITFGGHACFTADFSRLLLEKMTAAYDIPACANKYWVDFQDEHVEELPMWIKRCEKSDIVEFNSLVALQQFDETFCASEQSESMRYICCSLGVENERELTDFEPLKEVNAAIGCVFAYRGKRYRYLAEDKLINEL